MATQTTSDILEEDAADLQFPKDDDLSVDEEWYVSEFKTKEICTTCKKEIEREPLVLCVACSKTMICLNCFSIGLETVEHENNHDYRIDTRLCPFFNSSDWSKQEEIDLLDSVVEFGYGNWIDISKRILNRTPDEIETHFNKYYIDNYEKIEGFHEFDLNTCFQPIVCLNDYNATVMSEEPPRYPIGTSQSRYFGGYNSPRGDFEIEYDNSAEEIVSSLDFDNLDPNDPDYDLTMELQIVVIKNYNECLKERERRKLIIKEHGFLLLRKLSMLFSKYEYTITKLHFEKLYPFMQLISDEQLLYLLESLNHEIIMKRHFVKLKNFRQNGLKNFFSCQIFENLSLIRDDALRDLKQMKTTPNLMYKCLSDKNIEVQSGSKHTGTSGRRQAPPLNIVLFPGYEKLTKEERDLCSTARILPESYFTFKNILINESNRNNGIKLATARQLIKIDVNKTRKLYNMLAELQLIKPIS